MVNVISRPNNGRVLFILTVLALSSANTAISATPTSDTPPWKDMSLGSDDIKLSIDGAFRERYEWADHRDLGLSGGRDSAFMERFLLGARLDASPWFSSYVQTGSSFASTRPDGNKPTDRNDAYLNQAYIDLKWPVDSSSAGLIRIGRQEIPLGSLHLMGTRDGPNIRRAFDAVRSSWQWQDYKIDVFAARPITLQKSAFLNRTNHSEKVWGIYGTTTDPAYWTGIDLYTFGFEKEDATYLEGTGRERRYTVGMRLFGNQSGFDWDNEAAWQFGEFKNDDIRAWSASAHAGYTFSTLAWDPRIGIKTGVASGDKHKGDGKLNTFNAMYPKLPYLTENGIVAPANLIDISPSLQFTPVKSVLVDLSWHSMWRQEKNDAFWVAPGRPVKNTEGGGRYIGHQTQIEATWTPIDSLQLKAAWAFFDVSDHLEQAGLHDMNFVMTSATFTF